MLRKSHMILATGLALAVGVSGIAFGDAAGQVSTIDGKVTKSKQPKRQFKPASLYTAVTTLSEGNSPVIPSAPSEEVYIDYDNDIKISLGSVPSCTQVLNGTTTAEARALCPSSIVSKTGDPRNTAKARVPGIPAPNNEVSDFTVTAFHGTGNVLLLHAYSPTLGDANTQVVVGSVINSPLGGDYGKRLSVPDVPDAAGDAGALVAFGAIIKRGGVVKARCRDRNKKWNFRGEWHYESADGSDTATDVATDRQTCRVKRRRNRR